MYTEQCRLFTTLWITPVERKLHSIESLGASYRQNLYLGFSGGFKYILAVAEVIIRVVGEISLAVIPPRDPVRIENKQMQITPTGQSQELLLNGFMMSQTQSKVSKL